MNSHPPLETTALSVPTGKPRDRVESSEGLHAKKEVKHNFLWKSAR